MQYLLLIYHSEIDWGRLSPAQQEVIYREYRDLIQELAASGQLIRGDQLKPASAATTVRLRNGNTDRIDGPFAETKEQVGGYFLVKVKTLDEALKIAARIPSARDGAIEVREVIPTQKD